MQLQIEKKPERWIQFQEFCTKIISIVASEFPKPVALNTDELFKPRISENEKFECRETVERRRRHRADVVKKLVDAVGKRAIFRLRDAAQAGDDTPAGWIAAFKLTFDAAAIEIADSARHVAFKIVAQMGDKKEPLPEDSVRPWDLEGVSDELNHRLFDAITKELHLLLRDVGVEAGISDVNELAKYVMGYRIDSDLKLTAINPTDWLYSPDGLLTKSPEAMNLLKVLTKQSFDEACRREPCTDWLRVEELRTSYWQSEDRDETLIGTIAYLVDAGIILEKPVNDDLMLYTLSPSMVAPLMSVKSLESGKSGFSMLSTLRNSGKEAGKELMKEVAEMVFTAAAVRLGKLALSGLNIIA